MDRRFMVRKQEMLAECEVSSEVFTGMVERLGQFVEPFAAALVRPEQRTHALTYMRGLLSDLKRKNVEAIAYRDDQDRRCLQHFIGIAEWDHRPLQRELVRQVGRTIGEGDGVIVFDPSAFPKCGKQSVGVARQWCGRLGKVDNCQVGVYMGYASRKEHALVDTRLFLPQKWTADSVRCRSAGVPRGTRHQTRHTQALEMLAENGPFLPHAWVTGDDEMGSSAGFRRDLHDRGETYLLAVPSNTTIRDLQAEPPPYGGSGHPPRRRFEQVRHWYESLPESAWIKLFVRDGEKGPLEIEIVACPVLAKINHRNMSYNETLVVTRYRDETGATTHDGYFSNAPANTSLREFARVAKAAHRVEDCFKRAKSEAGLADYEVRQWKGWHHHQILSLIACWFLVLETLRGEKNNSGHHGSSDPRSPLNAVASRLQVRHTQPNCETQNTPTYQKRASPLLSPQST